MEIEGNKEVWGAPPLGPNRIDLGLWGPVVGVKTGGSWVRGPELCVCGSMITGDKGHSVYPGSGPLDRGKTILLLD